MADPQLHADLKALSQAIKSLHDEVAELRKDRADSGKSVSSIRIDTGGASAWFSSRVASYCCAFMLGLSLGLSAIVIATWAKVGNVESSANANKAYLSAIFQRQPGLKAELDTAKEPKK